MSDVMPDRCPFCGHHAEVNEWADNTAMIACVSCGAHGPISDTEAAALTAWNRRAGGEVALREALESCITHMIGWPDPEDVAYCIDKARAALTQPSAAAGWRDIATAPRNGTPVDLWGDGERYPDCFWGNTDHTCGEAGQYCDSDWHSEEPGWVYSCINVMLWVKPTHWMPPPNGPLPAPPEVGE